MNKLISTVLFFALFSCKCDTEQVSVKKQEKPKQSEFAIVIHGGAGTISKENMTLELEKLYRNKLEEAIRAGYIVLKSGGSSTEAVEASICIMEDSPLFNAGKGAVFTNEGTNELDASVMEGKKLNAGAVAGVKTIKNPIKAAIEVMNNSNHVLLSGAGADRFADERGLETVNPSYFYTKRRFNSLQKLKDSKKPSVKSGKKSAYYSTYKNNNKFGTVGCVALDKKGNISAGTSTGGMTNKRWNRIGDSPIIGAGTYANNNSCGVSATGWGEYFIRGVIAHDIAAQIEYKNISLKEAAYNVIQNKLTKLGGKGGIIAIDKYGNTVFEFNTTGMYRASMNDKGKLNLEIFK
ncbi:MAG: isoaspartyl peptidase/L-asparaginase family protein [Tenacibaculum sp.]